MGEDGILFGKKQVDVILKDLDKKGEYKTKAEILNEIRSLDPELAHIEITMIQTLFMLIGAGVGLVARKYMTRLLDKYFSN